MTGKWNGLSKGSWSAISRAPHLNALAFFAKGDGSHGWILLKYAHAQVGSLLGQGCYWDDHELVQAQSNIYLKQPGWKSANLDGTRLIWAESGRLWTGSLTDYGPTKPRLLHDFTTWPSNVARPPTNPASPPPAIRSPPSCAALKAGAHLHPQLHPLL